MITIIITPIVIRNTPNQNNSFAFILLYAKNVPRTAKKRTNNISIVGLL